MIRIIISAVLAIHGLIHVIGFFKEWNLGPKGSFSGKTLFPLSENISKVVGILWLAAFILLIIAALGYYLKKDWFWILAAGAIVVSQALIIIYWHDAKWGTIPNVIIFIVVILSAAKFNFSKMVRQEVQRILTASSREKQILTEDVVAGLPPIIRTWLHNAHVVGKEMPAYVHVIQKGSMRTDAKGNWLPFDAEQYFTIDPPAFVWIANIHADKFIDIAGRDKYEHGKGNMLIKAASLITIANSRGNEINQGTLIRYMAEMAWFPHAAVSDYFDWEQIDDRHARVTMSYNSVIASGVYTFNKQGFPIGFEAERFGEFDHKYSKEIWSVATTSQGDFDGMRIGNASQVTWKLKGGDFMWLKLAITDITYE